MIELACRDVVFHFNTRHLKDSSIPMWVVKTKGESYYVNHVESDVPWSTKETPDNKHTKGSLKFKDVFLLINSENDAIISKLTPEIEERIKAKNRDPVRLLYEHHRGHEQDHDFSP